MEGRRVHTKFYGVLSQPHFRNLLLYLSFFNASSPFPFLLQIFLLGVSPNSTQYSSIRIYSSFFLNWSPTILFHFTKWVLNLMAKHKYKYKSTLHVPFCFIFKHPFSPISISSSPFFLSPSHSCFSNQQAPQDPSTLLPLFCLFFFFFLLLLLSRLIWMIFLFLFSFGLKQELWDGICYP